MGQNISLGVKEPISKANKIAETLPVGKAALHKNEDYVFIDLRDIRELKREGKMPGAFSCPRGMLEFWIDPEIPYHKNIFDQDIKDIGVCTEPIQGKLRSTVTIANHINKTNDEKYFYEY